MLLGLSLTLTLPTPYLHLPTYLLTNHLPTQFLRKLPMLYEILYGKKSME